MQYDLKNLSRTKFKHKNGKMETRKWSTITISRNILRSKEAHVKNFFSPKGYT